jgi:hypothetical protein
MWYFVHIDGRGLAPPRTGKGSTIMTIAKQIENCRTFLRLGNPGAYARGMSANIRSSRSDRASNAFRAAIADDKAEQHFHNLKTSCPVAR